MVVRGIFALLSVVIVVSVVVAAVAGEPAMDLARANRPPGPAAWFGTDRFGRDLGYVGAAALSSMVGRALGAGLLAVALMVAVAAVGRLTAVAVAGTLVAAVPATIVLVTAAIAMGPRAAPIAWFAVISVPALAPGIVQFVEELRNVRRSTAVVEARLLGLRRRTVFAHYELPLVLPTLVAVVFSTMHKTIVFDTIIHFLGYRPFGSATSVGALVNEAQGLLMYTPAGMEPQLVLPLVLIGTLWLWVLLGRTVIEGGTRAPHALRNQS